MNRGKRSVGVDLTKAEGRELIHELAKTSDVFLTNCLPAQRQKPKVDLEHIRAVTRTSSTPAAAHAATGARSAKSAWRSLGAIR